MTLAVIGGTGFGAFAGLTKTQDRKISTAFGDAELQTGQLQGKPLIFLPRHGMPARKLPHEINYRANLAALKELGATSVLAVTAVGTVDPELKVPALVIPDQIIDYTFGRAQQFSQRHCSTLIFQSLMIVSFEDVCSKQLSKLRQTCQRWSWSRREFMAVLRDPDWNLLRKLNDWGAMGAPS